jgi:SAM-dependent methyltransferase
MRPHIHAFVKKCAELLPSPEPIVEIGAFQVPGQEKISDLRPLFPGKNYTGCDMQPGIGVDRIENIHALQFSDGEVGTFVLADTLEHVSDPIRGMREIHRCLREDGVAIFTSVMHFHIHGYPNDYWRFTPEAFRLLAEPFATAAIFYGGPEKFPHTVCGVAAKAGYPAAKIEALAVALAKLETPAPLHLQPEAARLVQSLIDRQLAKFAPSKKKAAFPSGFGRFSKPGWYLVSGQWIEGWVIANDVAAVEVHANGRCVHRTQLTLARPDAAEKNGVSDTQRPLGFLDQVHLDPADTFAGPLEMHVVDHQGQCHFVRQSAPGILAGDVEISAGLQQHSFDQR